MSPTLDRARWKRTTFGHVVRNVNDYFDADRDGVLPYVAGPNINPGDPSVASYGATDDENFPPTFKRIFQSGDVLLHSRGIDKLAAADRSGVTGEKLFVLRSLDETVLLQKYLIWLLLSPQAQAHMKDNLTGSVNKFLNWKPLAALEFDLPPLEEQERIADLLWRVEHHRRAIEHNCEAMRGIYERSRLALLTIGPRGPWTVAEIPHDVANRWTECVPEGWSAETIASVGRVRSGATPKRSEQARYFDGGKTPWVKTLDLNEGILVKTDECITDVAVAETSAKVVPAGTVLVAMYGGFGQIGRTTKLGMDAATNQAISAVLELRDDVDPSFLHEILKAGRPRWRKVAASSRKDPNITKSDVQAFAFPLPPLEQQLQILEVLGQIQRSIDQLDSERAGLVVLRASLLTEIFGGN